VKLNSRFYTQSEIGNRKLEIDYSGSPILARLEIVVYPFRNILFPTDFKPHTREALKYAAAFAHGGAGRVVVFSVQSSKVPSDLLATEEKTDPTTEDGRVSQLRNDFKDVLTDPLFKGIDVEPVIVAGEPVTEIAKAALNFGSDLVTVVSSRRKFTRALWGSTAEEIIAEAPCPVLMIRPQGRDFVEQVENRSELRLKRILLATNFRPSSSAATQVATQLANQHCAELHALYVIGDYFEQFSAMFPEGGLSALTRIRGFANEHLAKLARGAGEGSITHIGEGRPYEEIVKLALAQEIDLIVIGTSVHASLFGGSPVLGSEIERVVRNAPCPVLCVPASKVLTPLPAFVTQPV
jgi:nucleotide-binding universal stress UspA family protein